MNNDLFDKVYKKAESGNFVLIGFSAVQSKTYCPLFIQMKETLCYDHKNGLVICQPSLTYLAIYINGYYSLNDVKIWDSLTKTDLYAAYIFISCEINKNYFIHKNFLKI